MKVGIKMGKKMEEGCMFIKMEGSMMDSGRMEYNMGMALFGGRMGKGGKVDGWMGRRFKEIIDFITSIDIIS